VLVGSRRKAWLASVTLPSPDRVEPRCPHFGFCGGCQTQSLSPSAQLRLKAERVEGFLRAFEPTVDLLPVQPSPAQWFYRSKVEYSFNHFQDQLWLGFNRKGRFNQVLNVDRCFIGPPQTKELLQRTRDWADAHGLEGWNARLETGILKFMVHRYSAATGQWQAVLVTTPAISPEALSAWAASIATMGPTSLLWVSQQSTSAAVNPDSETLLYGQERYDERLLGLRYQLGWRSFFQSNPPAYARMLLRAREWLDLQPGQRLLDLCCGVGTIGLSVTPPGCELIGVESVEAAVLDARRNATENGRLAEFHCGLAQDWPNLSCDVMVLDPPRSGTHQKLLHRLLNEGPERILYISCNHQRLEDELRTLAPAYRLARAQLYDFFPQTVHLETLALLERRI
jgi:23S rRNA (uracil1939-C5)-methyltransferase